MNSGDYPTSITGFRFLKRRELPPVSTCWDFAVTDEFSADSATELLLKLPEDFELCYFDPDAKREEGWIFIRRAEQRYFMSRTQRGVSPKYSPISFDSVRASFISSPLVQRLPPDGIDSFTIMRIPDHQRDWHLHDHDAA